MKDAVFVDGALDDLRQFPDAPRREAGYQLDRVQQGLDPVDWKPAAGVGRNVREIRIHEEGEYRLLYVASFPEGVYVLHAFRKKTQRTARRDIELARRRYRAVVMMRNQR